MARLAAAAAKGATSQPAAQGATVALRGRTNSNRWRASWRFGWYDRHQIDVKDQGRVWGNSPFLGHLDCRPGGGGRREGPSWPVSQVGRHCDPPMISHPHQLQGRAHSGDHLFHREHRSLSAITGGGRKHLAIRQSANVAHGDAIGPAGMSARRRTGGQDLIADAWHHHGGSARQGRRSGERRSGSAKNQA